MKTILEIVVELSSKIDESNITLEIELPVNRSQKLFCLAKKYACLPLKT